MIFLFITSCSSDDSAPVEEQEEQKEITLEGDYTGTWNSTTDMDITFTDYIVSARFEFSNTAKTKLRGEFFATPSFTSCCNNNNDGTMLLNLDGDTISSFSFNDIITNCEGNFTGKGSITSKTPFTLEIDFTGSDCDGQHIGQLVFKRTKN